MIPRTNPPFSRKCGLKIGQRLILNLFLTTFTTASTQGPIDVVFVEVQFLYSHLFPIKFLHGRIPDVYQPIIKDFLVEWGVWSFWESSCAWVDTCAFISEWWNLHGFALLYLPYYLPSYLRKMLHSELFQFEPAALAMYTLRFTLSRKNRRKFII